MVLHQIPQINSQQREFFSKGHTLDIDFRRNQLRQLLENTRKHEAALLAALKQDLGKPETEAFVGEIAFCYEELRLAIKKLNRWSKPTRVPGQWHQALARCRIHSQPLGQVLIIGPWNYPVQLILAPLIGALAAGNTVVLKPSELAPQTSRCLAELIKKTFPPEQVWCIEGGAEISQALLAEKWNHIFFTGGLRVGKVVMEAASKYLTPVTL